MSSARPIPRQPFSCVQPAFHTCSHIVPTPSVNSLSTNRSQSRRSPVPFTLVPPAMTRGVFIVVEGPDGSGKTTALQHSVQALHAAKTKLAPDTPWRFPDRTTQIGKMIDAYLKCDTQVDDRAMHLLFSANRWEMAEKIKSALQRGESVITDRYAFSGVAYSVAKGLNMEWCKAPDRGLPAPDIVIYLDVPFSTLKTRPGFGRERYENEQMQTKVVEAFKKMASPSWRIVDADTDILLTYSRCLDIILPGIVKLQEAPYPPPLWTDEEDAEEDHGDDSEDQGDDS